ncbi:MAG: hypothetical protein R2753_00945 [Chitinophagales bacterium]
MKRSLKITTILFVCLVSTAMLKAQTNETMASGSYIINMGVVPPN